MNLQLQATFATLIATRNTSPTSISLASILSLFPQKSAEIVLKNTGNEFEIIFNFPNADAGWSRQILENCLIPELFSFGSITFLNSGKLYNIDISQITITNPSATTLSASYAGDSEIEQIKIVLDEVSAREWLLEKDVKKYIEQRTWVGTGQQSAGQAKVRVRLVTQEFMMEQSVNPVVRNEKIIDIPVGKYNYTGTVRASLGGDGNIRHRIYGDVCKTSSCIKLPFEGLCLEIVFDIFPPIDIAILLRSQAEWMRAIKFIKKEIDKLVQNGWLGQLEKEAERQRDLKALKILEDRQQKLNNCEFVYYKSQKIFRVPQNEMDVICLFMKLSTIPEFRQSPFNCNVIEYTAKRGIDAIGDFRLDRESVLNQCVPIEFEFEFENFLQHEHPIKQTKLVICWEISDPSADFLKVGDYPWLMHYSSQDQQVPVVSVKELPGLSIK